MPDRFEQGTILDISFFLALAKDALDKEGIVFMTGRTYSFGDRCDDFAEIAGQMIVLGLVQELQQIWQKWLGMVRCAGEEDIVDVVTLATQDLHGHEG
jgi:hypothetical protein